MMDAPQRMTQMKNIGVRPRPLVPITMLAVATGRTAKTIARHPPWEKDHVDKASPVGPAAVARSWEEGLRHPFLHLPSSPLPPGPGVS